MQPFCVLVVSIMLMSASCALFGSHKAPAAPRRFHQAPQQAAPVTQLPSRIRSAPVSVGTPAPLNLPRRSSPEPLVTLENGDDTRAKAQRLLEQASVKLAHINRAELAESTASTYQQANELINAAQQAMGEHDYPAASSLAEKASALTSQLPVQVSR